MQLYRERIMSIHGYLQILIAFISISATLTDRNQYEYYEYPHHHPQHHSQHHSQPYPHLLPHPYCGANEILCVSGGCIDRRTACDGIFHCPDGSDETPMLCQNQECPWYMFRCAYGACTRISSICNGVYDCVDKSDEPPYHSCRLDNIPPQSTSKPTTIMTTKSTTKHYTPFPYPPGPTTSTSKHPPIEHSSPPPIRTTPPSTEKTSTTKHYTPFPSISTTTERHTSTPTTTSNQQRSTESRATTYTPTPKPSPTVTTTERGSTSAPSANSCTLPPRTADKTYTIDGCEASDPSDTVCRAEAGQPIDEGVAINFACKSSAKRFTTYCLKRKWVPDVNSFSCDETSSDCGNLTANLRANTYVPWQVGVYDGSSGSYTCQGVILSPYVIVSAAHCFFDTTTNQQRSPSEFHITVGKKSRHKNANRSHIHNVTEIRFPPDGFKGSTTNFVGDIVLLEVTPAILFSSDVSSCCLDPSANQYSDKEIAGFVSAYNDNGGNGYTETTRVTFTSYEKCIQMVEDGSKSLVASDKICLVGQSIEQGNAGNGLYTLKGGSSQSSQYRLRAVIGTTFYDSKASGQVSTLTDIAKHLSWLPEAVIEINRSHENETLIDIRGPFSLS